MNYLIPNNPFNPDRLYKLFILGWLIVLALIVSDMFKSCRESEHDAEISPIKHRIAADIKRKDSVKEVIVYRDSIRTKYITKWRTIRHDSLIPCETKLVACDSLIKADSSLIASQKHEIRLSDSVIINFQKVAKIDSNTIIVLKTDLKKQKRKTKLALLVAAIFGGVAVLK